MNLVVRKAMKSHRPIILTNQRLTFSTQTLEPKPPLDSGLVYGKLFGITKHTTKSDILLLLDGCNVSMDDIRVGHNRSLTPVSMMMQFSGRQFFQAASRVLNRRGRFYRLEMSDGTQWQNFIPYDGKSILLQGIPTLAQYDDIERFLSGCAYDPSVPLQIITRRTDPEADPTRMVVVQFPSRAQAAYAFLKTNREFCLNEQISVRVLE